MSNQQHRRSQPSRRPQDRSLGIRLTFRGDDGKIPPDLFDTTAHQAAEIVAQCGQQMNKSTQLRRFYDELVMWQEKATQHPDKFDEYLPFVRMLKAKAAYAEGRKLVDGAFVDLLNQTIDSIRTKDDLRVAKLFLEAFLGFYKLEKGD